MKINKKALMWSGIYATIALGVYFLFFKKKDETSKLALAPQTGDPLYDQATSNVGKSAFAVDTAINVRRTPEVNNGKYNNIIGEVLANKEVGTIKSATIGKDKKIWYYVESPKDFTCPVSKCGVSMSTIGLGTKFGYVRSDVVTIK